MSYIDHSRDYSIDSLYSVFTHHVVIVYLTRSIMVISQTLQQLSAQYHKYAQPLR